MEKLLEEILKREDGWLLLGLLTPWVGMGVCAFLIFKYGWMGFNKRLTPPSGQAVAKQIIEKVNGGINRQEFESAVSGINATLSSIRKGQVALTAAMADLELKLSERIARLEERKK